MSNSTSITFSRQDLAFREVYYTIPWYLYVILFSSTSIIIGLIWDVSWHMSIGRDTLWSPPHLATYLGGIGAGLAAGFQVLKVTFWGTPAEKESTVNIWGFRGPLGGWFCIWGAFAMLTSAPFDDWWHNAYGLDVKILSPPHVVLLLGMAMIQLGAMIAIVPELNKSRQSGEAQAAKNIKKLGLMHSYAVAILITMLDVTFSSYFYPRKQHLPVFYKIACIIFPLFFVSASKSSSLRWPATITAVFYMLIVLELNWILQLFPAEPKLAPIKNPITHMVPIGFPLLLVFPALALDLVKQKWHHLNGWLKSLLYGFVFLTVFFPVQWYFSIFMLTPYSRNFMFMGDGSYPFFSDPNWPGRYVFWPYEGSSIDFIINIVMALLFAFISSRLGYSWGKWMRRVVR